jgi:hypothetical protein
MLFSTRVLRYILGTLWLIDGLFQLQPQMFTLNMINGVMLPAAQGQPLPVANSLQEIIIVAAQHLTLFNLLIVVVQIVIGLLLLTGFWVRGAVIASIVWALLVWYGGEGMSMLLTGQASVLTGAPGAVLLYPILGLCIYPRASAKTAAPGAESRSLLSSMQLRWVLAGFWIFAALLQLQPYWWQSGQISSLMSSMIGQGGFNGVLIDPMLRLFSTLTASIEIPLNVVLIEVFLGLGIALAVVKQKHLRSWLIASIVVGIAIWWVVQGFGMIFTGQATDFNSGLLVMLMTLACWTRMPSRHVLKSRAIKEVKQSESSAQLA